MEQSQGFTLSELMVVVFVVTVLALILFPAIGSARDDNDMAACRNHLRLLAGAVQSYAEDYDGLIPVSGAYSNLWPTQQIFMRAGYMRRMDAWVCPSFPPHEYDRYNPGHSYAVIRCVGHDEPLEKDLGIPSRMREALRYAYDDAGNWLGRFGTYVQLRDVEKPSDYFLIGERTSGEVQSASWVGPRHPRNRIHLRHGEVTNMVFADGKVESAGKERLKELGWGQVWTYGLESLTL